jgi:hypothetical protein
MEDDMNREQIIETIARGICDSHLADETIPYRKLNDGTMVRVVDDHDHQDGTRPYWDWFHGHQAKAALSALEAAGIVIVPVEPTEGLLRSMAIRYDHGLGVPGYYDQPMFAKYSVSHDQRLAGIMTTMRQLHEEVVGTGFYQAKKDEK